MLRLFQLTLHRRQADWPFVLYSTTQFLSLSVFLPLSLSSDVRALEKLSIVFSSLFCLFVVVVVVVVVVAIVTFSGLVVVVLVVIAKSYCC